MFKRFANYTSAGTTVSSSALQVYKNNSLLSHTLEATTKDNVTKYVIELLYVHHQSF